MNNKQINLLDVIRLCLANWWRIGISAVVAAVLAFFITQYFISPTYISRGSLYVTNNSATVENQEYVNLTDIATSQQLAFTLIELFTSDTFMGRVQEASGLPYTAQQIKSMVTMEPLNETEIIEVRAVCYSPEHAQLIVKTILDSAFSEVYRVIGGGNVSVIDEASLPEFPASPSKVKNVIIGFLFGAILSAVILFLIDFFDTRIKHEEELMKIKELPLLGVIPDFEYIQAEVEKNGKQK